VALCPASSAGLGPNPPDRATDLQPRTDYGLGPFISSSGAYRRGLAPRPTSRPGPCPWPMDALGLKSQPAHGRHLNPLHVCGHMLAAYSVYGPMHTGGIQGTRGGSQGTRGGPQGTMDHMCAVVNRPAIRSLNGIHGPPAIRSPVGVFGTKQAAAPEPTCQAPSHLTGRVGVGAGVAGSSTHTLGAPHPWPGRASLPPCATLPQPEIEEGGGLCTPAWHLGCRGH